MNQKKHITNDLVPSEFQLSQNYPNPFITSTNIKYSVPFRTPVIIKLFDNFGTLVKMLVNEEKPAGTYELNWISENFPSGIYFYQMKAADFVETKKMVLIK
jgi:hypothetical protein